MPTKDLNYYVITGVCYKRNSAITDLLKNVDVSDKGDSPMVSLP